MKIAYLDCFAGISGDMTLGALLDAGLKIDDLKSELRKLSLNGYSIRSESVTRNGIAGTKVFVECEEAEEHRHLADIVNLINASKLASQIKSHAIEVFENLARAEATIHNTTPDKIHFHEVGAVDAIVDIVGTVIGLDLLKISRVISSPVTVGRGFTKCQHGTIPIPSPATLELVKGLPVNAADLEFEMTTPTGAAILKTLADEFGSIPKMTVESVGYGAGSRELSIPNLLRIVVGTQSMGAGDCDSMELIETNIDDMNPEFYDYVMKKLFAAGAVDVWLTPVIMKKSRPGQTLSILTSRSAASTAIDVVLSETTSLGIRRQSVNRQKLPRTKLEVATQFGKIGAKAALMNGKVRSVAPEYKDCALAADEFKVPIQVVFEAVRKAASDLLGDDDESSISST